MHLDTTVVFMTTGWLYIVTLGGLLGVEISEFVARRYLTESSAIFRLTRTTGNGFLLPTRGGNPPRLLLHIRAYIREGGSCMIGMIRYQR